MLYLGAFLLQVSDSVRGQLDVKTAFDEAKHAEVSRIPTFLEEANLRD